MLISSRNQIAAVIPFIASRRRDAHQYGSWLRELELRPVHGESAARPKNACEIENFALPQRAYGPSA
jgi:hypothetical protein